MQRHGGHPRAPRGSPVWELELRVTARRPVGLDADLHPDGPRPGLLRSPRWCGSFKDTPIEFRTTVENATRDHRLRVVFPVGAAAAPPAAAVRAEGQFALVQRPLAPPQPRTDWVEPPDPTQHALGAVALGPLAVLTKGLPEYEARPSAAGPELCLTLLRATGVISRPTGAIATRPLGAGPQVSTPEGQCLGRHELEYALLAGADELDAVALLRASQDYRCPFLVSFPLDRPIWEFKLRLGDGSLSVGRHQSHYRGSRQRPARWSCS